MLQSGPGISPNGDPNLVLELRPAHRKQRQLRETAKTHEAAEMRICVGAGRSRSWPNPNRWLGSTGLRWVMVPVMATTLRPPRPVAHPRNLGSHHPRKLGYRPDPSVPHTDPVYGTAERTGPMP